MVSNREKGNDYFLHGTKYQTTMSISGRANRRSYFTRPSSRSVTWRTVGCLLYTSDCGCGSPGGERAAAALKEFAASFQERNPHLRVFNMVLHMDEATPHLYVDFVPVASGQSRGLSTRVSMKQALKQQGFESLGRKQTEWKAWICLLYTSRCV